ncbi:unnamed protein product [Camellia sinensis]
MKLVDIRPSMEGLKIPFLFSSLFSILVVSNAVDTITKTHSIAGSNTIVSSGGSFEMGFFSLGNSQNTYLGIWYKKISRKTVVWVANREIPLIDSSGVLTVINPGIIALVNSTGSVIWSPNVTGSTQDPVAQLMESGNLVVKDANDTNEAWKELCNGPRAPPLLLEDRGSVDLFRTGPWNGIGFSGRPNRKPNTIYRYEVVYTKEEVYYHYELLSSVVSGFVLSHDGVVEHWTWIDRTQEWILYLTGPTDNCDKYKLCGPNGSCNVRNMPSCGCLSKFVPRNQTEWGNRDWSNGCVRRTTLDCKSGDGFLKYSQYKMPDTRSSWFGKNMTLRECEMICLENCSCMAYTNLDIRGGGSGCLLWFGELIDMREYSEDGPDIYIKMASSELVQQVVLNGKKRKIVAVTLAILIALLLLGMCLIVYLRKRKKKNSQLRREGNLMHNSEQGHTNKSQTEDLELPLFDLAIIVNWTNNFSINNKLGEGGFGPVYKEHGLNLIPARSFGGNETEANTKRVVGTYFASTSLAMHGDYEEGKSLELIDETLWDLRYQTEMLRSIHVGLLCVQESLEDRPSMSSIVLMLGNEATLPRAKQPGFFTARNVLQPGSSSSKKATTSANEITITLLNAR